MTTLEAAADAILSESNSLTNHMVSPFGAYFRSRVEKVPKGLLALPYLSGIDKVTMQIRFSARGNCSGLKKLKNRLRSNFRGSASMIGVVDENDHFLFQHHFKNPMDFYSLRTIENSLLIAKVQFNPTHTIISKGESFDEFKTIFRIPKMTRTSSEKRNQYSTLPNLPDSYDWPHVLRAQAKRSEKEALLAFLQVLNAAEISYANEDIRCSVVEAEHFVDFYTYDVFKTFVTFREGVISTTRTWDFSRVKSANLFDSLTAYPANEKERCEELYVAICAIQKVGPPAGILRLESRLFPDRKGYSLPCYSIEDFSKKPNRVAALTFFSGNLLNSAQGFLEPRPLARFLQGRRVPLKKANVPRMRQRLKRRHLTGLVTFDLCAKTNRCYVSMDPTLKNSLLKIEESDFPLSTTVPEELKAHQSLGSTSA